MGADFQRKFNRKIFFLLERNFYYKGRGFPLGEDTAL